MSDESNATSDDQSSSEEVKVQKKHEHKKNQPGDKKGAAPEAGRGDVKRVDKNTFMSIQNKVMSKPDVK